MLRREMGTATHSPVMFCAAIVALTIPPHRCGIYPEKYLYAATKSE
jgi:hypothetical protein